MIITNTLQIYKQNNKHNDIKAYTFIEKCQFVV